MSKSTFVLGIFISVLGFLAITGSWSVYHHDSKILEEGDTAKATLQKKEIVTSSDGDNDYILTYSYSIPNGYVINSVKSVNVDLWSSLDKGSAFVVYYDADNPQENLPKGSGNNWIMIPVIISLIGSLFALFGIMMMFGKVKKAITKIN